MTLHFKQMANGKMYIYHQQYSRNIKEANSILYNWYNCHYNGILSHAICLLSNLFRNTYIIIVLSVNISCIFIANSTSIMELQFISCLDIQHDISVHSVYICVFVVDRNVPTSMTFIQRPYIFYSSDEDIVRDTDKRTVYGKRVDNQVTLNVHTYISGRIRVNSDKYRNTSSSLYQPSIGYTHSLYWCISVYIYRVTLYKLLSMLPI